MDNRIIRISWTVQAVAMPDGEARQFDVWVDVEAPSEQAAVERFADTLSHCLQHRVRVVGHGVTPF